MNDDDGCRKYVEINLSTDRLELIRRANQIIEEYSRDGLRITVRQLYYQFVARGMLENRQQNYQKVVGLVNDGRLAGLISWTAIEDRTRNLKGLETFDSPGEAVANARDSFRRDLWADQQWRLEVWVEKEALEGVIGQICNELRVDFFACRGYNSQSEQWRAGRRFASYIQKGQRPIVFHLGDHDPSGIDMTRDNRERLELFAGAPIMVQRLALNMNQIEKYNPPPNPAKVTDSRFAAYQEQFGDESWELDALDPRVIQELIRDAVHRIRDDELWQQALTEEVADRRMLDDMVVELGGKSDD